jgi:subtilisin family serine protease
VLGREVIQLLQAGLMAVAVTLFLVVPAKEESPRQQPQIRRSDRQYYETFHGVEVAAREVLVKLNHCPSVDAPTLVGQMTKFSRELTGDNSILVKEVGNNCLFSFRSATLTVPQLLAPFKSTTRVNQLLTSFNAGLQLAYAEPNFVIRVKPQKGDGPGVSPSNDYLRKRKRRPRQGSHHSGVLPPPGNPNDDYFQSGLLWGLKNTTQAGIDVNAVPAWALSTGSPSIVVGVIDTGIYYDHPDLIPNIWSAPEDFDVTLGTETLHCLKDSHGYNAIATTLEEACDPIDLDSHGTHVAGIIGAAGDNQIGVVGVNWHTQLMGLKFIGDHGGLVSDAIKTIEFAIQVQHRFGVQANLRVLNASWGYGVNDNLSDVESMALRDQIQRANDSDMLFVASAGEDNGNDNDVFPHYPSGYFDLPNLLSVTAFERRGGLAVIHGSASNHGVHSVHLAAPGRFIYSTYPIPLGYSYYQKSGTSMAAPFVSGAAALILSVPACSGLHAPDLKRVISQGTIRTRSVSCTATGGRLNIFRSMNLCNGIQ